MTTIVVNKYKKKFDIYIGRGSIWGNPFKIGPDGSRQEVIEKYRQYILKRPLLISQLHHLKDKRLGCFCAPQACHGDVLVQLIEEMDI